MRTDSPTFGKFVSVVLTGENKRMFFIPRHFAHGFAVLEPNSVFTYKCDNYYDPSSEGGIIWNDPDIAIPWPVTSEEVILSDRDKFWPSMKDLSKNR
jgi:dTDP-4-dehydrorhamnose 3,5-epimerase and related enzymes